MLKFQFSFVEQSFLFFREEVDIFRLKVEELEGEWSWLEEEKRMLEVQLEWCVLQGDYDQSRIKVLYMSLNFISVVRQCLCEDYSQLQVECE